MPQLTLVVLQGKILQDANTVESYNIEEKGFIVCMTSKVLFRLENPSKGSSSDSLSSLKQRQQLHRRMPHHQRLHLPQHKPQQPPLLQLQPHPQLQMLPPPPLLRRVQLLRPSSTTHQHLRWDQGNGKQPLPIWRAWVSLGPRLIAQ